MLAALSASCAWLVGDPGTAAGFYIFNLANAAGYGGLVILILTLHARENRRPVFPLNPSGVTSALSVLGVASLIALAAYENGAHGLSAMNAGIRAFTVTEVRATPAGAGHQRQLTYRLHFEWYGFGPNAPAGDLRDERRSEAGRPR
ncbi:hypothetical protein [uncultured Phenylobacterium sp.]|uniref:hypothetical protein n=1 Tax=uncultured Phenylobacterium sp. TaxID=349273 RepID=UPI0025E7BF8C|nr:hypothetical protein [uncultured Phenylobacterium sp.]